MVKVILSFFNEEKRYFDKPTEIEVQRVPNIGEKLMITENEIGYVYKVHDVKFNDNDLTDVYLVYISEIDRFNNEILPAGI